MLTGRTPFRAVNAEGWMFQHLQGVAEPIWQLRPDLAKEHPGLDSLVMRLLERDRENRFPSATALVEALSPKSPVPIPTPPIESGSAPRPVVAAEPQRSEEHTA